jgi:hypothetical protein
LSGDHWNPWPKNHNWRRESEGRQAVQRRIEFLETQRHRKSLPADAAQIANGQIAITKAFVR